MTMSNSQLDLTTATVADVDADRADPADPRDMVSLASQVLGAADHGDFVWGHASLRDPDGRGVWMKASGWGFSEITPDRVQLIDPDGNVLVGSGSRHSEYPIHTEIM